jgi:tetratricopeptide (TPR) repeat protein
MLEILRSVASASHAFVEGHQVPDGAILSNQDFATILRPQAKRTRDAMTIYETAIAQAESALMDQVRGPFRQCFETILSGFQWDPRQRALILDPAREYLSEALLDPEASGMGELWLLDGMLGLWLRDDPMVVERSFDRGIRCKVSSDPYILSLLHRFKALAAAQAGRFTQAFEGAHESLKLREDWGTYLELAHYSMPIENHVEALSAIRSACRLFPLSIAMVVSSDTLAPLWQTVDANFLRYLDDFRSHSIAELKHWEVAYDRAKNVIAAGLNFELPNDTVPDSDRIRSQLDQERGLRLISMPATIEANNNRLNTALAIFVSDQLTSRYEELRSVKAELKVAEKGREKAIAEAEREIRASQEALKRNTKASSVDTGASLGRCSGMIGLSLLIFLGVSIMSVMFKEGLFTQFPSLSLVLYVMSFMPAILGILMHASIVVKSNMVSQANRQKLDRWQKQYDDELQRIRGVSKDQMTVQEKRVALAEARYRCAQEAERAFRGETFRRKGSETDDVGRIAA